MNAINSRATAVTICCFALPSRQYSVDREGRSFALLRPSVDAPPQNRLRDLVLEAYSEHEAELAATA